MSPSTNTACQLLADAGEAVRDFTVGEIEYDVICKDLLAVMPATADTAVTAGEDHTRVHLGGVILIVCDGDRDCSKEVHVFVDNKNYERSVLIRQLAVVGRVLIRHGVTLTPNCIRHTAKPNCWLVQSEQEFYDLAMCKLVTNSDEQQLTFGHQDYYALVVPFRDNVMEVDVFLIPTRDAEFI